jgi:hypothetical protein
MDLLDHLDLLEIKQVAQIVYNDRLVDIFRDSNMIYVIYQNRLTQVPFTETILETLHNVFENHLIFEVVDFLFFQESGKIIEASEHQTEGVFSSTWVSHSIPFQLMLE